MSTSSDIDNLLTTGQNQNVSGSQTTTTNVAPFETIQAPTASQLQLQLTQAVIAGQITPQQASTIYQQQSALNNLQVDPAVEQQQYAALGQLAQVANSANGLTPESTAQMLQIYNSMNQQNQSNNAAIQQNAQARGLGTSGTQFGLEQSAQQGNAQNEANYMAQVQSNAQQQKMQALSGLASQSNALAGQQLSTQEAQGQAQNAINNFNTANAQSQANLNTQNNLAAQGANVANAQNVENQNTGIANTQAAANVGATQQAFNNQMGLAGALAKNTTTTTDTGSKNSSGNTGSAIQSGVNLLSTPAGQSAVSGIGSALSGAWNGVSDWLSSDIKNKKDIKPTKDSDIDSLMDGISGYKFKYKPNMGKGANDHLGIMAQDLEKVPGGKNMVRNGPNGKEIDGGQLAGHAMAALANLHKRLKDKGVI